MYYQEQCVFVEPNLIEKMKKHLIYRNVWVRLHAMPVAAYVAASS